MNEELIIHNETHPLLPLLQNLGLKCVKRHEVLSLRPVSVWDFTLTSTDEKRQLFKELTHLGVQHIHSDLSTAHGDLLVKEFIKIKSAFALACFSPKDSYELWQRNTDDEFGLLEKLPIQPKMVTSPGHCFIYPRVMATLINESRFARADKLASDIDLDKAMKYGVNYPLGLVEWEKRIGKSIIDLILADLCRETNNSRYKTC